jgi:hypothetical protein
VFRTLQLLILASVLSGHLMSAHSVAWMDGAPAPLDECCDQATPAPSPEAPGDGDDCCPNACQSCPLPCCGGSVAVTGALLAGMIGPGATSVVPPTSSAHSSASDPREIDHPPRI